MKNASCSCLYKRRILRTHIRVYMYVNAVYLYGAICFISPCRCRCHSFREPFGCGHMLRHGEVGVMSPNGIGPTRLKEISMLECGTLYHRAVKNSMIQLAALKRGSC